jgi:hypothetical protein
MFQAFDFAEPSVAKGDRESTTMAPQALFMLNGDLVQEQTRGLASKLLVEHPDDSRARVTELYQRALARDPTEAEIDRALRFVGEYAAHSEASSPAGDPTLAAWQALCRVIFASSEFIYVN